MWYAAGPSESSSSCFDQGLTYRDVGQNSESLKFVSQVNTSYNDVQQPSDNPAGSKDAKAFVNVAI